MAVSTVQSRKEVTRRLEDVLEDGEALDYFKQWAEQDVSRCPDAINLHFAIKAFRKEVEKNSSDAATLAVIAHKKFISPRTGSCSFLPKNVRDEMSQKAHGIKTLTDLSSFFLPVTSPLANHLACLHASFLCSAICHKYIEGPDSVNLPDIRSNPFRIEAHPKVNDRSKFANQLDEKLQALNELMAKRGVEFARDLGNAKENIDELLDDATEKDVDDYITRLDNNSKRQSASASPPSLRSRSPPSTSSMYGMKGSLYGTDGFAPPPTNRLRRKMMDGHSPSASTTKIRRSSNTRGFSSGSSGFYSAGDSSLFGPSTSFHYNTVARPQRFPGESASDTYSDHVTSGFATFSRRSSHPYYYNSGFATLPRKHKKPDDKKMTLKLLESGKCPMIAKVDQSTFTLAQFRTIFGIAAREKKFFFKSECDDGSFEYQWSLIEDERAEVPVFQGLITAEVRPFNDSP